MDTYLFVTKPEYKSHLVKQGTRHRWSCSKTTKKGDRILVYVATQGIVEQWFATSDAAPHKEWKFMCGVRHKRTFRRALKLAQIVQIFTKSQWGAAHQYFRGYRSISLSENVTARLAPYLRSAKLIRTAAVVRPRSVLRDLLHPDELGPNKKYAEGTPKQVLVNAYERNAKARKHCVRLYGACCIVCKLVMGDRYGMVGKDFIHVHHLRPLARTKGKYVLDPKTDLVPVCPNCHAMLHRPLKMLTPKQLQVKLNRAGK